MTTGTRTCTRQHVRWCPEAETWQPGDEPYCRWQQGYGPSHRLRLRWMFVCSITECEQAYFSQKDFDAHICYSAY